MVKKLNVSYKIAIKQLLHCWCVSLLSLLVADSVASDRLGK